MKKYLKRYNNETKEWEIISPDISVTQVFEGDTHITDTNVFVTNYQYTEKGNETNLNDTLGVIGNDIAKLKRNVSWLAEHGGGGSGSGGGTMQSYGIELISPILKNGAVYTNNEKLEIKFMITGGTEGDTCKYSYTNDNIVSGYKEIEVGKEISVTVDYTNSSTSSHIFEIRAINPYNNTIKPLSFPIYISKFTVINDTSINIPGSIQYVQGFYNVSKDYKGAYIPLKVQCGLLNAVITINGKWNNVTVPTTFTSLTTDEQIVKIPLWDIIGEGLVNNVYIIEFSGQATFGDMPAIDAKPIRLSVKVINPSELTIAASVNAQSIATQILIPYKDVMSYTFTFLGPGNISTLKYAAKIKNGSDEFLINGSKYYDETLKEENCTYMDNESTSLGVSVSKNLIINDGFNVGDEPYLYIKGWSYNGSYTAELAISLKIINMLNNIFPRQLNPHTLFASWNNEYNVTNKNIWKSVITDYDFLYQGYVGDCINTLEVFKSNENSGMMTDSNNVLSLRLQNHACASIDFSQYKNEIEFLSGIISRVENIGFTISITLSSDDSNINSTLFLWGINNNDGTLSEGIKITNNKAYWNLYDKLGGFNTLSVNIPSNTKTTIDFVYDATRKECLIYVNGEPNAAKDYTEKGGISVSNFLPEKVYFGGDYYNNTISDFSDMNVYDFSIYTSKLNDLQLNINSKNARLNGLSSSPDVISDYNIWKKKNFIYTQENAESIPLCYLFNNGEYIEEFNIETVRYIYSNSNIPTLLLNFNNDFTEDVFFNTADKETAKKHYACEVQYYASNLEGNKACNFNGEISLQGTSTLKYRVKNLELYTTSFIENGVEKPYLFQPISKWFPESEFTLKADVVDSAHANNAVIGEWINESGLLSNTPPMNAYLGNEPKDIKQNGEIVKTINVETGIETDYHKEVSIRHTLEGFPILLFISFSNKSTYQLIGIYSFNLGRYSYYNMGMKFLKNFCKRDINGNLEACPCLISKYEESETLGTLNSAKVYSYEFENNEIGAGNSNDVFIPLWTQYDRGILEKMGSFKYPSTISDKIWDNLKSTFMAVAESPTGHYETKDSFAYNGYNNMLIYYLNSQGIVTTDGTLMPQNTLNYLTVKEKLHLDNFYAYYVIVNAFGLTDSLGKNMVLRSWDDGESWWPCFYDMDTALGLNNDGVENIPVTCYIDTFTCSSDTLTQITQTGITYHDINDYAAGNAKIWGLLRDLLFFYEIDGEEYQYENIWGKLRSSNGKLSTHKDFVELIKNKVNTCGELVYCKDYYSKYIRTGKDTIPALSFLHGNRIEYINDWLKKHFYYLDGMLDAKEHWASRYSFASSDAPLYNDDFTWAFHYTTGNKIPLTFRPSTPTFITLDTNTQGAEKFYLGDTQKDFTIYYTNNTAANTQTTLFGSTLLSKFGGLESSGFKHIMSSSKNSALYLLKDINISHNATINDRNPLVDLNVFKKDNKSYAENVNLSYLTFSKTYEGDKSFETDFSKFNKLLNLNIQSSDINSLILPNSSLQTLNVKNSKIVALRLRNQNIISDVNIDGCNDLTVFELDNCNAITSVNISDKRNITNISIYNCNNLKTITIKNNPSLITINVSNCNQLENVIIDNCNNDNLLINLSNCPLKNITINNILSSKPINLPNKSLISNLKVLDLSNCYNITALKYDTDDIETYIDNNGIERNVFDLSPLTNIEEKNIRLKNIVGISCIRVANIETKPFNISNGVLGNNKNLIRIFGHISITTTETFSGYEHFYINEPLDKINGITPFVEPTFVTDDIHYTNITIRTNNLSATFAKTNCSLSDAYYILQKCDGVINLSNLFSYCKNIKTNRIDLLNKNIFQHCTDATNIDSIFDGCEIIGYLHSDILKNMLNLESFNFVFGPNNFDIFIYCQGDENKFFFPRNSKIKTIDGFNPKGYNDDSSYDANNGLGSPFYDKCLLYHLKNLEKITNSFNNCYINFYRPGHLFSENNKLKNITKSFRYIAGDTDGPDGPINNLFEGSAIEEITNSFIISQGDYFVDFNIGNSFFSKVKNTISKINDNSLTGNKCRKYIDYEDCNGKPFPYEIFKECINLVDMCGFFSGLMHKNDSPYKDAIAYIPSNGMFDNCTNLSNIDNLFSNMEIKYTLSPEGFKNCKITNASSLFADSTNRYGAIPYKFFYQKDGNLITNLANCFAGFGENMEYYTCSDELINNELYIDNETGNEFKKQWNIYIFDGSANFYQKINDKINYLGLENFNRYKYTINNTIYYVDNISDVPEGITPENVICYKKDGILFLPELPPQFKKDYVNVWTRGTISKNDLLGSDSDVHKDIITLNTDSLNIFRNVTNYFCPPDIFKYCKNSSNLNIDSTFKNSSTITDDGSIIGMYGKIPPYLLNHLTNITSINGLFNSCMGLIPDKIGYSTTDEEHLGNLYPIELFKGLNNLIAINGLFGNNIMWGKCLISENLFTPIANNIIYANSLFENAKWINNIKNDGYQLPTNIFRGFNNLENISDMFYNSTIHISSNMFNSITNPLLKDVSNFMCYSNGYGRVPEFWNTWMYIQFYNSCFKGIIDNNIENYQSIPENYKI